MHIACNVAKMAESTSESAVEAGPQAATGVISATDGRPHGSPLAAEMASISKSFYGTMAIDAVDFDLRWGEVHALLGENGAGKTSLCSVLAGLYRPDDGEVSVDGQPVSFASPRDALAAASPRVSDSKIARRLGSASAWKMRSSSTAALSILER